MSLSRRLLRAHQRGNHSRSNAMLETLREQTPLLEQIPRDAAIIMDQCGRIRGWVPAEKKAEWNVTLLAAGGRIERLDGSPLLVPIRGGAQP